MFMGSLHLISVDHIPQPVDGDADDDIRTDVEGEHGHVLIDGAEDVTEPPLVGVEPDELDKCRHQQQNVRYVQVYFEQNKATLQGKGIG